MISYSHVAAGRGWAWIERGIATLRAAPALWLGMAIVYLVIALVLEQIPFIGRLILVLFTPLMLLGALPVAAAIAGGKGLPAGSMPTTPAGREPRAWAGYLRDLLAAGARRLFGGTSDEEKLLPVMVISTLLLGGVVVVQILAQLLKVGGAALPAMLSGSAGPTVWVTALLGLAIVLTLDVLLIMAFAFTVPLILFRREHPLPSIDASFRAAINNFGAFAILGGVFVVASVVSRLLFHFLPFPADYLVFLAIGVVALPVFVGSLYAGYQELFPTRSR